MEPVFLTDSEPSVIPVGCSLAKPTAQPSLLQPGAKMSEQAVEARRSTYMRAEPSWVQEPS